MTHRFHLLFGRVFEFVEHRRNWGEDRVYFDDERGELRSLPAAWTDVVAEDPFVVLAAGRSRFRVEDLLALADVVDRLGSRSRPRRGRCVKPTTPQP